MYSAFFPSKRQGAAAILFLISGLQVDEANAQPVIERVNLRPDGTESASHPSSSLGFFASPMSADGRYVAFVNLATDLVANDNNGALSDVFVRDMLLRTTTLQSRRGDGIQADDQSGAPSISADGQQLAFTTRAQNFGFASGGGTAIVVLKSLSNGATTLVSRQPNGQTASGESTSNRYSISPDGGFVGFNAMAVNLVAGILADPNGAYLFNRSNGTVRGSSIDVNNRIVFGPFVALSENAQTVTFSGNSFSSFTLGDTNGWEDVVVRRNDQNILASLGANGEPADRGSFEPAITADGRFVAFVSNASNLVPNDGPGTDVFVRDLVSATTRRANSNRSGGAATNTSATSVSISDDGRYLAFVDVATDIVAGDTNGVADAFVRDLHAGRTTRISVNAQRQQANGPSGSVMISRNGRYATFASTASNLVANDTNNRLDIFRVDLDQIVGMLQDGFE